MPVLFVKGPGNVLDESCKASIARRVSHSLSRLLPPNDPVAMFFEVAASAPSVYVVMVGRGPNTADQVCATIMQALPRQGWTVNPAVYPPEDTAINGVVRPPTGTVSQS